MTYKIQDVLLTSAVVGISAALLYQASARITAAIIKSKPDLDAAEDSVIQTLVEISSMEDRIKQELETQSKIDERVANEQSKRT